MNPTHRYRTFVLSNTNRGITVVEVIVAVGIVALVAVFAAVTVSQLVASRLSLLHETERVYAAEEGYEMVRFLRDSDWDTFAALDTNEAHYLDISTSTIAFTDTPEFVAPDVARRIHIDPLYRDGGGAVVASSTAGASSDAGGRVVTVEVAGPRGTTTLESILTNLFSQ